MTNEQIDEAMKADLAGSLAVLVALRLANLKRLVLGQIVAILDRRIEEHP